MQGSIGDDVCGPELAQGVKIDCEDTEKEREEVKKGKGLACILCGSLNKSVPNVL